LDRILPNLDFLKLSEFFQKCQTQQLKISKKVWLAIRQFRKNSASVAEDYKKTSGPLLRIPEKPRIDC